MRSAQGALCCVLVFASVAQAVGDDLASTPLQPALGTRVRLSAPTVSGSPLVGTIAALDDRTFTLEIKGRHDHVTVPRDGVTKLELSTGRRSRGKGALVGAGIGVAAGTLVGLLHGSDDPTDIVAYSAGEYALGLGILGAGTGALIGVAVSPGERWKEVPVSGLRVTLGRTRSRGIAISASVAF